MSDIGIVAGATPSGVPHLAIPFLIGADGSALTVEQDSTDEVVQCVAVLVGTRPGTRPMVPAYGLTDPTFVGVQTGELTRAVARFEPRASVSVAVTPGGTEQVVVQVKNEVGTP